MHNRDKLNSCMIYFFTPVPFPVGGAGTARKYALARGLIKLGYHVHIISTINNGTGVGKLRKYNGVLFSCSAPKTAWGGNIIKKFIHVLVGQIRGFLFILKDSNNFSNIAITTNRLSIIYVFPIWVITRITNAYFFTELNENPIISRKRKSFFSVILSRINIWLSLRFYDDVFVMTYTLRELLIKRYSMKDNLTVLLNAIDFDRFDIEPINVLKRTVGYAGSLSFRKDSLDILINAIFKLRTIYPDVILRIAYFSSDPDLETFIKYIQREKCGSIVKMIPDIYNENIPQFLSSNNILALIRTRNEQTEYGFPTKLVEYLASKRPVIVSEIGDISRFLEDKINAYLIKNNSVNEIVASMYDAFKHPEKSEMIGRNGRLVAEQHFSCVHEAQKIIDKHLYWRSRRNNNE